MKKNILETGFWVCTCACVCEIIVTQPRETKKKKKTPTFINSGKLNNCFLIGKK